MKMWRTQISGLLKNEDNQLPHLLKMKTAFLKLLKTKDLKTPLKIVKKMKTMSCTGSPSYAHMSEGHISSDITLAVTSFQQRHEISHELSYHPNFDCV